MLDEKASRRPDLLQGTPVRLANGQGWTLPAPPDRVARGAEDADELLGPHYAATVTAVAASEDEADRLRNELALAICLLGRNYELSPADLRTLLGYAPEDPALFELQRALHEVAGDHVDRLLARRAAEAWRPTADRTQRRRAPHAIRKPMLTLRMWAGR